MFENDRRDMVWLVFTEFPFVLYFLFRLAGYDRTPVNVFSEAASFEGPPALWIERYRRCLSTFRSEDISALIDTGTSLLMEVRELSSAKLWTGQKPG